MFTLGHVMADKHKIFRDDDVPPPVPPKIGTGTDAAIRRVMRDGLPESYPADLSRSSAPESGSIGDGTMPISNRAPSWKSLKGGK